MVEHTRGKRNRHDLTSAQQRRRLSTLVNCQIAIPTYTESINGFLYRLILIIDRHKAHNPIPV